MPFEEGLDDVEQVEGGKIKVVCHGCGARYQVRDTKVRGRRFRAICKKCGGIIVARCTNAFTVMAERGEGTGSLPSTLQLGGEELYQEDDPSWYVVISGKPHGPLTTAQVRKSFNAGKVTARSYLWRAGDPEWRRLHEVPEFSDLFGEEPTSFYPKESEPLRQTGETLAAGPKGLRRRHDREELPAEEADADPARDHFLAVGTVDPDRARLIAPAREDDSAREESSGDDTALHYPEDASATGLVEAGRDYHPREPVDYQDSPDEYNDAPEAWDEPQWAHLPPMPRRRAVLPAPTGTPKIPSLIRPPAGASSTLAPPPSTTPEDFTRQLSDAEKRDLAPAPAPRPSPALAGPPAGAFQPTIPAPPLGPPLPPAPSEFPDLLPPLEPLRPLQPLPEEKTGFWSTGKIAALAAVGGGLAVAAAVVVAVTVVRPKSRPPVEPPRIQRAASPAAAAPQAPREPQITVKSAKTVEAPASGEEAPSAEAASGEEAPAAGGEEPAAKVAKKAKPAKAGKAVKLAKAGKAARRAPAADPDELLAAGAARKPAPKGARAAPKQADADEILAAGTQGKKTKRGKDEGAGDADAILAAGSGKRTKKAPETPAPETGPTKEQLRGQIHAAIRQVLPQARSCHDRHGQSGRVWVVVVLKPGATVPEVTVEGAFAGTPTGFCVLRALEGARLPRVTAKDVTIRYPFDLQ